MSFLHRSPIASAVAAPTLIVPSGAVFNPAAAVWPAANRAIFLRFTVPTATTMRYLNWVCSVASGNVQVGVVLLSGAQRTTYTRVMDSGVIVAPVAGVIRSDLGVTSLAPGEYATFMWADNVVFQTRYGGSSGLGGMRFMGEANSLATGVPASGTMAFGGGYCNLTLEGDV